MSAPDFYFAANAIFRHLGDHYGKQALADYWRSLAREYYRQRIEAWRSGGLAAIAADWRAYFAAEPQAEVEVLLHQHDVELIVRVCPAIKHLRDHGRDVAPCFCEHCDHTCGAMAEAAGYTFTRNGGSGSCRQWFVMGHESLGGGRWRPSRSRILRCTGSPRGWQVTFGSSFDAGTPSPRIPSG